MLVKQREGCSMTKLTLENIKEMLGEPNTRRLDWDDIQTFWETKYHEVGYLSLCNNEPNDFKGTLYYFDEYGVEFEIKTLEELKKETM